MSDNLPHQTTKVLYAYTPYDFGPLNVIDTRQINNFEGGKYYLTTPKEPIVVYRLYGGNAREGGQYWTVEPRDGNLGYRMDAAVMPQWNSLEHATKMIIPPGVLLFEGQVARQVTRERSLHGGGWQVFIPGNIINNLAEIQPGKLSGRANEQTVKRYLDRINEDQDKLMKRFEKEFNERLQQRATSNGSELRRLPGRILKFIQGSDGGQTGDKVEAGKYLVHKESIPGMGGKRKNVSVSVRIEFVRSETRTYQSGKTIVNETTNYYNRITEITETYS
ncbi:uncharacterized protein LOC128216127 [Mya arenaria]|uniref:uncharacterized protein LOC128216127 n=1 Tax=Mya arenaria TaxID=6604 RepID=UPI0022E095B0|nr:uncharacterized protein LOC128216127 [Mya arenaria]